MEEARKAGELPVCVGYLEVAGVKKWIAGSKRGYIVASSTHLARMAHIAKMIYCSKKKTTFKNVCNLRQFGPLQERLGKFFLASEPKEHIQTPKKHLEWVWCQISPLFSGPPPVVRTIKKI